MTTGLALADTARIALIGIGVVDDRTSVVWDVPFSAGSVSASQCVGRLAVQRWLETPAEAESCWRPTAKHLDYLWTAVQGRKDR
jgi:hypothetical protein